MKGCGICQESQQRRKLMFGRPHLLQLHHIFFYDHRFSPHVIGHIKAMQRFRFCSNSKFTCSSCLCTMFLSIAVLDMFLILSWASPLRCPRNTQPGSSEKSGLIRLFTVIYIIFLNPDSLNIKNEDNIELWIL